MDYNIAISEQSALVELSGQFTSVDAQKFKNILNIVLENKVKSITLDFASVTFIDSSSMGMLLLLRDECQSREISLTINSPQGQVQKIFTISKFEQFFSIT